MFSTELPTREERAWPGRLGSGEYLVSSPSVWGRNWRSPSLVVPTNLSVVSSLVWRHSGRPWLGWRGGGREGELRRGESPRTTTGRDYGIRRGRIRKDLGMRRNFDAFLRHLYSTQHTTDTIYVRISYYSSLSFSGLDQ